MTEKYRRGAGRWPGIPREAVADEAPIELELILRRYTHA
jgi:hypothetical protein